ncbi:hypothetical protein HYX58_05595 [Candidatus Dependentiae bacterium]|nr:hypothetical protein [Candidatus Dependentiae bacterium]
MHKKLLIINALVTIHILAMDSNQEIQTNEIQKKCLAINYQLLKEEKDRGNKTAETAINILIESAKQDHKIEITDVRTKGILRLHGFLDDNCVKPNALKFIKDMLNS